MYRVIPVRNDFHDMFVKTQREFNTLKKSGSKDNFLIISAGGPGNYKFILNDFKRQIGIK